MRNWIKTLTLDTDVKLIKKEAELLYNDLRRDISKLNADQTASEIVGRFKIFIETRQPELQTMKAKEALRKAVTKTFYAFAQSYSQSAPHVYTKLHADLNELLRSVGVTQDSTK